METKETRPDPSWFWARVNKQGPIPSGNPNIGRCWLWTGAKVPSGYGYIKVVSHGRRRSIMAHRLSWEMQKGDIPGNEFVRHKCDTRACVNPDHLILGTAQENMMDMAKRGRAGPGKHQFKVKVTQSLLERAEAVIELAKRVEQTEDREEALKAVVTHYEQSFRGGEHAETQPGKATPLPAVSHPTK
jgi:HNH endonuclease